jgi:hypothetical protein
MQTLKDFSQQDRRDFLRFVTASPQLPLGGFGVLGDIQISRVSYQRGAHPTARTCFRRLNLPEYPDFKTLRDGLLVAIRSIGVDMSDGIFDH